MPTRKPARSRFATLAELLDRLGGIPPERVRTEPPIGRATNWDLIRFREPGQYVLIDRVLVSKGLSPVRRYLVAQLAVLVGNFVKTDDRGALFGPGASVELLPGVVRNPDVSFVPWERLPNRRVPMVQIGRHAPDLAVEILSAGNTREEMRITAKEYFRGGVKLLWIINPEERTAESYTAPNAVTTIPADGTLDGAAVLPGFTLRLAALFANVPVPAPKKPTKRKKK